MIGGRLHPDDGREMLSTMPDIASDSPLYYRQFLLYCSVHLNGLQWPQEVVAGASGLLFGEKKRGGGVRWA